MVGHLNRFVNHRCMQRVLSSVSKQSSARDDEVKLTTHVRCSGASSRINSPNSAKGGNVRSPDLSLGPVPLQSALGDTRCLPTLAGRYCSRLLCEKWNSSRFGVITHQQLGGASMRLSVLVQLQGMYFDPV